MTGEAAARGGTKTVESRLTKRRHPAATRLSVGDTLYLKEAGGNVRARATATAIEVYGKIPAGGIAPLRTAWGERVGDDGPDDPYWAAKAEARHALLVTLADVRPCHIDRRLFRRNLPFASAWIVGQPDVTVLRAAGLV